MQIHELDVQCMNQLGLGWLMGIDRPVIRLGCCYYIVRFTICPCFYQVIGSSLIESQGPKDEYGIASQ